MTAGFARLHPVLQHHIANTLQWRGLRPLQEQAVEPVLAGADALLVLHAFQSTRCMGGTKCDPIPRRCALRYLVCATGRSSRKRV